MRKETMYDMAFVPDEWDIKGQKRPFPWIPVCFKPKHGGLYLIAVKDWHKPRMAYFRNPGWYCICSDSKLDEVKYWGHLPQVPQEQHGH